MNLVPALQSAFDAATPWLASVAVVFALMAVGARFIERKPCGEVLAHFRRLGLFWQIAVVLSVGSATKWAGAKGEGDRGGGSFPALRIGLVAGGGDGGQFPDGSGYTPLSVTGSPSYTNLAVSAIAVNATNIAIAATWDTVTHRADSLDVYWRTNLVAGGWERLAEVPIDTETSGVAFDVPAEWLDGAPVAFFRLGSRLDTDGDGLPDSLETLVCGTNPQCTDTDGDGLEDGEEFSIGTNPASVDTDSDGIQDGEELTLETNPASADTDGDGLTDAVELFQFAAATNEVRQWLDISAAVDFAILFTNADDEASHVILPFGFRLSNAVATNLSVDVNGLVAIGEGTNVLNDSYCQNRHATRIPIADGTSATIAAFWDDIVVSQEMASSVTFGTVGAAGSRTSVVEYHHVGFHEGLTNDFVSLQVQFPEAEKNVIRVVYSETSGQGNGSSATLGVRTSCGESIEYSFNENESVSSGLVITYRLGIDTDPLLYDTDEDGLGDGDEVLVWHTDPYLTDSDGDLLPDGFEVICGFLPTINNDDDSDLGNEAEFDYDGDGLDYLDEYLNGTTPFSADTDGDGVGDAAEVQNGSDPLAAADGGQPPPISEVLQVPLHIYGDYAAWEMRIVGKGPDDWRTYRISTHRPGDASSVTNNLRKGNSYEIAMVWNGSGSHVNPYWYCWEAQIDDVPDGRTFWDYSASRKPNVFNTVVGDGWWAENEDGLLTAHVHTCDGDGGYIAKRRKAYLHVLRPTVEIATNRLDGWIEIAQDKVIMSDEDLRIRIKVEPKVPSFDILKQALGDTYTIYTDTAPNGVEFAFAANDEFLQKESWSEVHITKTRQQLRDLGLLPTAEEDGVNEKATIDAGSHNPNEKSNLTDSTAFNALTAESRHDATHYGSMDATPPSSHATDGFFKSAGVEYVRVEYGGGMSHSRQLMNQADIFYVSGHGDHQLAYIYCTRYRAISPSDILDYWRDDLDCVVFLACSVLDIGDFVSKRLPDLELTRWKLAGGAWSPGKLWRGLGPTYFLGYGWKAPLDNQGSATIASAFAAEINAGKNPIEAWRIANDRSAGRNACAIDLSSIPAKYWYWEKNGWKSYTWDCKTEGVDW